MMDEQQLQLYRSMCWCESCAFIRQSGIELACHLTQACVCSILYNNTWRRLTPPANGVMPCTPQTHSSEPTNRLNQPFIHLSNQHPRTHPRACALLSSRTRLCVSAKEPTNGWSSLAAGLAGSLARLNTSGIQARSREAGSKRKEPVLLHSSVHVPRKMLFSSVNLFVEPR
jgi:hypothetical protein